MLSEEKLKDIEAAIPYGLSPTARRQIVDEAKRARAAEARLQEALDTLKKFVGTQGLAIIQRAQSPA